MDLSGRNLKCDVCEVSIETDQPFRVLSGALCSEGDKLNPKTHTVWLTRSTKKYLSLTVCGSEECGTTAIGRIWRATQL